MIEFKNNFRIEYTKGDTYALKLTFKKVTQDLTSAIFSVKENADDETALIEKTIGSGISKLEENFYKNELVYKLQLQAEDSRNLQADNLYLYDLKIAVDNVIKTVIKGNFVVTYNVTSVDNVNTTLAEIEVDDVIEADAETTPATAGIEYEQDPIAMAKIGDITQLNTTAKQNLVSAINEVNTKATASAEEITKIEDGTVSVPEATHATSADNATTADNATNSTKVQNVDFSANTTAQFGDYIVSKKKLVWSGNLSSGNSATIQLKYGAKYEIEFEDNWSVDCKHYALLSFQSLQELPLSNLYFSSGGIIMVGCQISYDNSTTTLAVGSAYYNVIDQNGTVSSSTNDNIYITKIYEILE